MNITSNRIFPLLIAIAIQITASPAAGADAVLPKVCVPADAGAACQPAGVGMRPARPMEIR
jgi:hypothetical protein